MEHLINLADFRERNDLSQAELGKYLGTTSAFISLIERGKSKMPVDKMLKLLDLARQNAWFTEDLVPAAERLRILEDYCFYYETLSPEEEASRREKYFSALPEKIREDIRLGQKGINSALADRIIASCPPKFTPNKEWLMTGKGPMFTWSKSLNEKGEWEDTFNYDKLKEKLISIEKKLDTLIEMLTNTSNYTSASD